MTAHERVTITKNGKLAAVVSSVEDLEALEETLLRAGQDASTTTARQSASMLCSRTRARKARDQHRGRVEHQTDIGSAYEIRLTPAARRAIDALPMGVALAALALITGDLADDLAAAVPDRHTASPVGNRRPP